MLVDWGWKSAHKRFVELKYLEFLAMLPVFVSVAMLGTASVPTLDRETLWIVSPTESDAVAAVIGR